jgi:pyruvate dehydrogenase (quinone)
MRFSSGYYAMHNCDVLLMLGTDFPSRQFCPKGNGIRIAQVDLQPENIDRRTAVDLGVVGDVKATLTSLLTAEGRTAHLTEAHGHYAKSHKALDELAVGSSGSSVIHWQQVAKALSDLASQDAVFTADVGLPTVLAARYLATNDKRRLIGSFTHGSMANAMAQAIDARAEFLDRQVISVSGDGGFTMPMGDFLSLLQLGLPVTTCVFNNGALGFLNFGTEFKNPNFAAMAGAVGIPSIRLERPAEVVDGVAAALAHHGPMLIDAVVNRQELAMPPTATVEMAKGFTLFMVKALMSGHGDELINLARTNPWR